MRIPHEEDCLLAPMGQPHPLDTWNLLGEDTSRLMPAILRIQDLADEGLEPIHIISSFLACVTAPLMARSHPGREYSGEGDTTRLLVGSGTELPLVHADWATDLMLGMEAVYPPPVPSLPMNLDVDAILAQMPVCDE